MTGLTDRQRSEFQLMKKLTYITKPDANKRIEESSKLIDIMLNNDKIREFVEKWKIILDPKPFIVQSKRLNPGNLIMGMKHNKRIEIDIDGENIERSTQTNMYSMPELKKWAIFVAKMENPKKLEDVCGKFMSSFEDAIKTFNYPARQPHLVYIQGKTISSWEESFKKYYFS